MKGDIQGLSEKSGRILATISFESSSELLAFKDLFIVMGTGALDYMPKEGDADHSGRGIDRKSDQSFSKVSVYAVEASKWIPNREGMKIINSAITDLHAIEDSLSCGLLASASSKVACFFKSYGSHIYVGEHGLGGAYLLRTTGTNEKDVCKQHEVFLERILNMSLALDDTLEEHSANIRHKCRKIGGPDGHCTLPFWELVLKPQVTTWVFIRMGGSRQCDYIPIWDLVLCQSDEFRTPNKLATFIQKDWERVTSMGSTITPVVSNHEIEENINRFVEYIERQMSSSRSSRLDVLRTLCFEIKWYLRLENDHCRDLLTSQLEDKGFLKIFLQDVRHLANAKDAKDICVFVIQIIDLLDTKIELFDTDTFVHAIETASMTTGSTLEQNRNMKTLVQNLAKILSHGQNMIKCFEAKKISERLVDYWCQYKVEGAMKDVLCGLQMKRASADYISLMENILQYQFDVNRMRFTQKLTLQSIQKLFTDIGKTINENKRRSQQAAIKEIVLQANSNNVSAEIRNLANIALKHLRNVPIGMHQDVRRILFEYENDHASVVDHLDKLDKYKTKQGSAVDTLRWNFFEQIGDPFFVYRDEDIKKKGTKELTEQACSVQLKKILETLGLISWYPRKISLQDVQTIHDNMFSDPENITNIPWAMLRRIITMDSTFRERVLENFVNKSESRFGDTDSEVQNSFSGLISNLDQNNGIDSYFSQNDKTASDDKIQNLHPSDVILAVISCSDMHLKRVLAHKIALCQFALPFIYQDFITDELVASTWSLRDMVQDSTSMSLLSIAAKKVSFIRIGDLKLCSKSKLINEFLRDQNEEHTTFFHKDCAMGQNKRTISNGVIEISWWHPHSLEKESEEETISSEEKGGTSFTNEKSAKGNKKEAAPKESLTILNLRGDATTYRKQVDVLCHISDLIVILIEHETMQCQDEQYPVLKTIHESRSKVLLVTQLPSDRDSAAKILATYKNNMQIKEEKTGILSLYDVRQRKRLNANDIKRALWKDVSRLLTNVTGVRSLGDIVLSMKGQLAVDEDDVMCRQGQTLVDALFSTFKTNDTSHFKDHILPLQGEQLWHKWSKIQKESKRSGVRATYDETEKLEKDMQSIRRSQISKCNSGNMFIANFVKLLLQHVDNADLVMFILSWIRYFLDSKSRQDLPIRHRTFQRAFKQFSVATDEKKKRELKKQIELAEQELVYASVGLEHCFREIGQIYEAFISETEDTKTPISEKTMIVLMNLPRIVAKLVLMGLPLELMDGDTANVPTRWMKAVFEAIKNQTKCRVCLLSVLGIQSSGKSTLLNSMFGLQFAVSAGRCTRGVYAQLIPVNKDQSSLQFDYVMVIDTEGLRAPELADEKFHHDNELATFVIGLGDYIIINVKGENIADMENVLQIVIHSLLRLKQVHKDLKLEQSCTFLHQNVSARDAYKQMQQGHQKTMQSLDNMTKEVAMEEHMSQIESFKDVIAFEPTQPGSIQYIPDLWHGSPPMAPCSLAYSEKVAEVARYVIIETKTLGRGFSMDDAFAHLDSLWGGILKEDFVFSFRNSLEVKAYGLLEFEFQQECWAIEKTKLKWLNQNVKPRLSKCADDRELDNCSERLYAEIEKTLGEKGLEVKANIQKFIDESDLKSHMKHWNESKLRSVDSLVDGLKSDMRRRVRDTVGQCKVHLSSSNLLDRKQKEINKQALALAKALEGNNPPQYEIQEKFEKLWKRWFDEIAKEFGKISYDDKNKILHESIVSTLSNLFRNHYQLVNHGLQSREIDRGDPHEQLTGTFEVSQKRHLNLTVTRTLKGFVGFADKKACKAKARRIVDEIFAVLDEDFDNWSKQDAECGVTELSQLLRTVQQGFKNFNDQRGEFTLNHQMEIDVALHVSRHAFRLFKEYNGVFYERHSVKSKLQAYKRKALQIFNDTVSTKSKEVITANILCMEMKDIVFEKVMRDITDKTVKTMKSKFSFLKDSLLKDILTDLGQQSDFQKIIQYVEHPKRYALKWFKRTADAELFETHTERSSFQEWSETGVSSLITEINRDVHHTPKSAASMAEWLSAFRTNIERHHLALTPTSFSHVEDVSDFESFCECVKDGLQLKQTELLEEFRNTTAETVKWGGTSPYEDILDSLWGCSEECPWCGESCQHGKDHDPIAEYHHCIQHRPVGINGIHKLDTEELVVESCNFKVQSSNTLRCGNWCKCTQENCSTDHPYKDYKTYIPSWDIQPQSNMSESKYWAWIMAQFADDFTNHYGRKPPIIPDSWQKITKLEAIQSLGIRQ